MINSQYSINRQSLSDYYLGAYFQVKSKLSTQYVSYADIDFMRKCAEPLHPEKLQSASH